MKFWMLLLACLLAGGAAAETLLPNVNEYLSLRSGASLDAAVIERVLPGEKLEVLGWKGKFALVRTPSGAEGYVHSGYVMAENADLSRWPYDYEAMLADAARIHQAGAQMELIAVSHDGRAIPALRIGTGETHVLIQAGIHGRELMSGRLAMDLLEAFVKEHPEGIEGATLHVIPMVNPDGVQIAVYGSDAVNDPELRETVDEILEREGVSPDRWKANARGVDLNRNFPTEWENLTGRTPGSSRYRGESPLCEPESIALKEYFERYDFAATVSYHSYGSLIYWQGAKGELNDVNEEFAKLVGECTGYPLSYSEMGSVERGGFKDWALMDCGVPGVTVEIGAMDSMGSPEEYSGILLRHAGSWEKIVNWALER